MKLTTPGIDQRPGASGGKASGARRGKARHAAGFTLAETMVALLLLAIVIPVAVEAISAASLSGEVAARKGAATRVADRVLERKHRSDKLEQRCPERNGVGRRTGFSLDAHQPDLAARCDGTGDGGSEVYGAGQRLFGDVEHAGKFPDSTNPAGPVIGQHDFPVSGHEN